MSFSLIVTLAVLLAVVVALFQERVGAEFVMLAALLILTLCGVITVEQALAGFANQGVLTIAALLVVGAGLRYTGALEILGGWLLGRPKPGTPIVRLLLPIAGLSAFLNNTTIVAFFLPIFMHTAKKLKVSPSKLLLPLSYATVLGGTCTVIGTSTNMVIDGMLRDHRQHERAKLNPNDGMPKAGDGIAIFELAWVGVPVTAIGLVYLAIFGRRLLPDRADLLERVGTNPREYVVEMVVRSDCPFVDRSVRASGLRDLPGLYLYRIERASEVVTPVAPGETLRAGDVLVFSGIVSTVVDLRKMKGLEPADHRDDPPLSDDTKLSLMTKSSGDSLDSLEGVKVVEPRRATPSVHRGRRLHEVVVSPSSPLVGSSVKDIDFRERYQASIIAIHRNSAKLEEKIGKTILQPGDTLLVDGPENFGQHWRNSPDFILVSGVEDSEPVAHDKTWIALAILAGVVAGMTIVPEQPAIVSAVGAVLMILSGCVRSNEAHRSMEVGILLLVAAALGVSKALDASGAAELIAGGILRAALPLGKFAVLATLVFLTGLLTELLSNNACAALMGSLAIATAQQLGVDPKPLIIAVAVASSYGFATPFGYQTNLMVYSPGNYRFSDYLKLGIPLDLICWTVTVFAVYWAWPF